MSESGSASNQVQILTWLGQVMAELREDGPMFEALSRVASEMKRLADQVVELEKLVPLKGGIPLKQYVAEQERDLLRTAIRELHQIASSGESDIRAIGKVLDRFPELRP